MPLTYILLECDGPEGATEAEAVGHITGVLAQHGALGVHHTARGDVVVSLLAGAVQPCTPITARYESPEKLIKALRGLAFDVNRTATPFGVRDDREAQR